MNNIFFLCKKYKNFARIVREASKRKYDNGFHKCCFFILSTSYPALFSFHQKEKCTWDGVFIYTGTLVLELSFPNTSVYDANHFTWYQQFDEGPFFHTEKRKFWKLNSGCFNQSLHLTDWMMFRFLRQSQN